MVYESKSSKAQKLMSNSRTIGGTGGYFSAPAVAGATGQEPPNAGQQQQEQVGIGDADNAVAANVVNVAGDSGAGQHNDDNGADGDSDGSSDGEESDGPAPDDSEYWPQPVMAYFDLLKQEVDRSVKLKGRGRTARFEGKFPREYSQLIKPSEDPEAYFDHQRLDRNHFAMPHIQFWLPEALHPRYFPTARPPCKWHGTHECVSIEGWVKSPRHCYGEDRVIALIGKKYKCKIRKKAGDVPCFFRGYDRDVIANSNDYIRMIWRKIGFDVSHRGAISWRLLERLQSYMLQSLSVSGFRASLVECAMNYHLRLSVQWRAYVDSLTTHKPSLTGKGDDGDSDSESDTLESPAERARRLGNSKKRRRKNAAPRCRRCGKHWNIDPWKDLHKRQEIAIDPNDPRPQNKYLWHGVNNQVWDHCKVETKDYEQVSLA